MTEVNATFKQALKLNVKRALVYWAPLSMMLGGFGTLMGFYTIFTYTTTIGRPDLLAAAIEAKSSLVLWLLIVVLVVAAYLLILMTTAVLFGLAVSLFNDASSLQAHIVKVLLWPVLLGIVAFMAAAFQMPELGGIWKIALTMLLFFLVILVPLVSPGFRLAVDLSATAALPEKPNNWTIRAWLLIMLAFLLLGTIISAVFPASLILKAYSGEETAEAATTLMLISIFSAGITLIPVVVFYVSKADVFKRIFLCVAAAFAVLVVVVVVSPGSTSSIVYAAASVMKVRDQVEASFLLTEAYAAEDFDPKVWGKVGVLRGQPLIKAFPLFSFGDVLLLCPVKLMKTERKDWPVESAYCAVTQNSKAVRMPKHAEEATEIINSIKPEAQKPSA